MSDRKLLKTFFECIKIQNHVYMGESSVVVQPLTHSHRKSVLCILFYIICASVAVETDIIYFISFTYTQKKNPHTRDTNKKKLLRIR